MLKNTIFFKEDNNLSYSNKIIELYKWLNNNDLANKLNENDCSDEIITFLLSYPSITRDLFKKNPLLLYRYIDFFNNNQNNIKKKKENVSNFLTDYNYKDFEIIFDYCINFFEHNKIKLDEINKYESIIEDMEINQEKYLYYILNNSFNSNIIITKTLTEEGFISLSKQMIIFYYYKMFFKKNVKISDFHVKNLEEYNEFIKILIRQDYNMVYEENNNELLYVENMKTGIKCSDSTIKECIKIYFEHMVRCNEINKNLIIWFFFLFKDEIPKNILNDFFFYNF